MKLLIATCDAFQHVLPLTIRFLRSAWPGNECPYPIEVVTNTVKDEVDQLLRRDGLIDTVTYLGVDAGWSNNMIKYLESSDMIHTNEPFLLMLEDYIICHVEPAALNECINIIETHDNVGMIRLVPIPGPTINWNDYRGRNKIVGELDRSTHTSYCMSLQIALWKPRTLYETLEPDMNPWKTEGRGSKRIARRQICRNTHFLCARESVFKYKNLLRRGKPDQEVMEWILSQGGNKDAVLRCTR